MAFTITAILIGSVLGAAGAEQPFLGMLLGGTLGWALGWARQARKKASALEIELHGLSGTIEALKARLDGGEAAPEKAPAAAEPAATEQPATPAASEPRPAEPAVATTIKAPTATAGLTASEPRATADESAPEARSPATPSQPSAPATPPAPHAIDVALAAVKEWFFGGNTVVRVAVIITIIGVGLLGKWAADREFFPPELRLVLAALIGIVLLVVGWRVRDKKRGFAMTVQGGGVGVIYVTVFMALRIYEFIPAWMAFLLFVGLAVFSQLMAVLQDAKPLAVLGVVGGFLAPIMASTGSGNYVVLFSYYTILNAGIFAVAWFKAWRILNWVGFVFTFGVATFWGVARYEPENFATTQPFLIIFFLFYVGVSVLYAWKQGPKLRGLVDGTLVFGTPIVVFTLQSGLVEGEKFGLAFSSFALAIFYIGSASALWQVAPKTMRNFVEAFLVIGVAFATMAIPFAVDDHHITGATWALEGAGLVWIGIRQQRLLPRISGILLQPAAAIAFAASDGVHDPTAFINGRFLGCLMLAMAGMFIAWYLQRHRERIHLVWVILGHMLLGWALLWWLGGALHELDDLLARRFELTGSIGLFVLTAAALDLLGKRLDWGAARNAALLYLPMAMILLLAAAATHEHPFAEHGYAVWLLGFVAFYLVLHRQQARLNRVVGSLLHAGTLWLMAAVFSWELVYGLDQLTGGVGSWAPGAVAWAPALALGAVIVLQRRDSWWPMGAWRVGYLAVGGGVLFVYLLLAGFALTVTQAGDADPLPYLPIINPTDLALALSIVMALTWWQTVEAQEYDWAKKELRGLVVWTIFAGTILWLNGVLVRTVHQYAGVPFNSEAMYASMILQTSLSIFWTILALSLMVVGTLKHRRVLWAIGATFLGVVVLKLFIVDLATLSTIAKIVSFLVVGGLMLLIGYLAPVPPARSKPTTTPTDSPADEPGSTE